MYWTDVYSCSTFESYNESRRQGPGERAAIRHLVPLPRISVKGPCCSEPAGPGANEESGRAGWALARGDYTTASGKRYSGVVL